MARVAARSSGHSDDESMVTTTSSGRTTRDASPLAPFTAESPHRGWGIGGRTEVYRSSGLACCTVFTPSGMCGRSFSAADSVPNACSAVTVASATDVPLVSAAGSSTASMSPAGHTTPSRGTRRWRDSTYATMSCTMVGRRPSGRSHTAASKMLPSWNRRSSAFSPQNARNAAAWCVW